jgi:hypothetical protein
VSPVPTGSRIGISSDFGLKAIMHMSYITRHHYTNDVAETLTASLPILKGDFI